MSPETILDVLIGKSDPLTLADAGITIEFRPSGVSIEEPAGTPIVLASVRDVASGYVAAWAGGGESLRRWGQTVLCLLAIDLSALEHSEDGEALLDAVSEAADGRADGLELAVRLAQ